MCTYLGASTQLDPDDLDLSMVRDTKVLYLEGYLWDSPAAKKAFIRRLKPAEIAADKLPSPCQMASASTVTVRAFSSLSMGMWMCLPE